MITVENSLFCIDRSLDELEWNSFVRVPVTALTTLNQVRVQFEQIDVLAESIARNRLLHPIVAAYLDEEHCQSYLREHNRNWGTSHQISDAARVRGVERDFYLIVVAGGRRKAAIEYMQIKGCLTCQEKYGPGPCYHNHVPDQLVMVNLRPNISFYEGFELQMNENTHMPVPPEREAEVLGVFFRSQRELNPSYKPIDVARGLGRSEGFVRRALKYVEVPSQIQRAVENKDLPYAVACEIARLNGYVPELEQLRWAVNWHTRKYRTVSAFATDISEELARIKGGQTTMINLFFSDDQQEVLEAAKRRAVLRTTVDGLSEITDNLRSIGGLFKYSLLKREDSPYLNRQAIEAHLKTARLIRPWLAHLLELAQNPLHKDISTKAQDIQEGLGLVEVTERLLITANNQLPEGNGYNSANFQLFS